MMLACCRMGCPSSIKDAIRYHPCIYALSIAAFLLLVAMAYVANDMRMDLRFQHAQRASLPTSASSGGRTGHVSGEGQSPSTPSPPELKPQSTASSGNYPNPYLGHSRGENPIQGRKQSGESQSNRGQSGSYQGQVQNGVSPRVTVTEVIRNTNIPFKQEMFGHTPDTLGAVKVVLELTHNDTIKDTLLQLAKVKQFKPQKVTLKNDHWQVVGGSLEIYLYSAYFDDRPTLSRHYVRVIGIFEVPVVNIFCLLWYANETILAAAEIYKIGVRYPRHGKYFDPSLASCTLPKWKPPPTHVSIITPSQNISSTLLDVQIPEKPESVHEFGVCVSVTYWRHSPVKVVEWLELHRLWGAGEVTVYNNSLANDTAHVLQFYANEGFVDFRQAPNCVDDDDEMTILMNMSPVINDCMYRNLYRYKHIICVDFDELIVPRKHRTYHDVIEKTQQQIPSLHQYRSYMARNVYFFLDFGPVTEEPWFLLTTRYFRRVPPSEYGFSVKSITNPMACIGLQNHVCWHLVPGFRTDGWLTEIPLDVAMNQHYKLCHMDIQGQQGECLVAMQNMTEDRTMQRFDHELEYHAAQMLYRLNLL